MSTANPNRTNLLGTRWCEAGFNHPGHVHTWRGERVYCAGTDDRVSAQEPSGVQEPSRTLTGLSTADLGLLAEALATHREAAPVGMDYRHLDTLKAKIVDAWIWSM